MSSELNNGMPLNTEKASSSIIDSLMLDGLTGGATGRVNYGVTGGLTTGMTGGDYYGANAGYSSGLTSGISAGFPTGITSGLTNGMTGGDYYGVNGTTCFDEVSSRKVNDEIVVSGVSGRFPECENIEQFAQKLFTDRASFGSFGQEYPKFESEFFGIGKEWTGDEQLLRLLFKVSYECMFDTGMNVSELKGTRTGVFIGVNPLTTEETSQTPIAFTKLFANRLSGLFGFKGPECVIETTSASGLIAFDKAVESIRMGECDYALIAGLNFVNGKLVEDVLSVVFIQNKSTCRRFYANVLGSKSVKESFVNGGIETIKRRVWTEVYGEYNIDPSMVTYVETHGQVKQHEINLFADLFINKAKLTRSTPLFIGSTMTSSLKSTLGRQIVESSGLCSLVKILISIQHGMIPAGFYTQDKLVIPTGLVCLKENTKFVGGLMVLNSLTALNDVSVCGGLQTTTTLNNVHILLQPNTEHFMSKMGSSYLWNQPELIADLSKSPRVFPFCSETQQGLEEIMRHVERTPTDLAMHCLLNSHSINTPRTHPYRGFTVLNGEQKIERQIEKICDEQKPVWFLFSGMGVEEWRSGMGKELMQLEAFRRSIFKSTEIVRPFGIDLLDIVYGRDRQTQQELEIILSSMKSCVALTAIQIALIDCLRQVGIKADGMLGYSIGELACAYADQCLTHEQALMCAYYRAKCVLEAQLPECLMAKVSGLTWEQLKSRCPSGIVPVCFDSVDQFSITGPRKNVREFLRELQSEGIYVREIKQQKESENLALLHSFYMTSIAPVLKSKLEGLNLGEKQRSTRWISTSVPEHKWQSDLARFSSVDYFVNNLCSPVLFQQGLRHVPKNAILVEIAPRSIMQTLLKKCAQPTLKMIPLMPFMTESEMTGSESKNVSYKNQLEHLLVQFGKLYLHGVDFDSVKMFVPRNFEKTIYPVPFKTGYLSHLIRWNEEPVVAPTGVETFKYVIDIENLLEKDSYLLGHQINGRILYPTTGYLYLVWKSLAKINKPRTSTITETIFSDAEEEFLPSVAFENVQIHRATVLRDLIEQQQIREQGLRQKVEFQVRIQAGNGQFELVEGENVIVSGRVYVPTESMIEFESMSTSNTESMMINKSEIYTQFRSMGYEFKGEFQPIVRSNLNGTQGESVWTGKWIPFLDAMLQMNIFGQQQMKKQNGLLLPTRIRSIKVDPRQHLTRMDKWNRSVNLPIFYDPYTNRTQCGAIEITGLHLTPVVLPIGQYYPAISTLMTTGSTGFGMPQTQHVSFVPFIEKHFDCETGAGESYVVVDRVPSTVGSQMVDCVGDLKVNLIGQNREFFEYYLSECRRYIQYIVKRIEYPMQSTVMIQPTPLPRLVQEQLENLTIYHQTVKAQTPAQMRLVELMEGGKLLKFLKETVKSVEYPTTSTMTSTMTSYSQIGEGEIYAEKLQKMFMENFSYLKALEEDLVLNSLSKRVNYLRSFLDTVMENWSTTASSSISRGMIRNGNTGLRILEISPSMGQFFGSKINTLLKEYPELNGLPIDYHYVPLKTSSTWNINEQLIDGYLSEVNKDLINIQMRPIERLDWNFGVRNGQFISQIPVELQGEYDLVILNGVLSGLLPFVDNEYEIKKWLKITMDRVMKPTGFMFVHEHTNNFDFVEQLNKLEHITLFNGLMNNQTTWNVQQQQNKLTQQIKQLQSIKQSIISAKGQESCETQYKITQQLKQLQKMQTQTQIPIPIMGCEGSSTSSFPTSVSTSPWRPQVKYQTEMQWRQIIEDGSFLPIGLKSDSLLTSMFLYRRCGAVQTGLLNEIKIVIDDCMNTNEYVPVSGAEFMWLEKVRLALMDSKVDRVWLISEKLSLPVIAQMGLMKVIGDLKREFSGDRLRCLFIVDQEPIKNNVFFPYGACSTSPSTLASSVSQSIGQWTRIFEQIRKADLFMNVFQFGKWGTFRPIGCQPEMITNGSSWKTVEQQQQQPRIESLMTLGKWTEGAMENSEISTGLTGFFNPRQTYLIVGGLDCEFGYELAQWMVQSGVRHLILTTLKPSLFDLKMLNNSQLIKLREVQEKFNAEIKLVSSLDLNDETECLLLVKQACRMSQIEGKIGGIFSLNGLFERSSVQSLMNLEKCTRVSNVMEDTGLFVLFTKSGVSTSTILEKVCEYRELNGKHCLLVDWNTLFGADCLVNIEGSMTIDIGRQGLMRLEKMLIKSKVAEPVESRLMSTMSTSRSFTIKNLMPKRIIEKLNEIEYVNVEQQIPLFVIHPIEGHVNMLKQWAKHINYPVFGLQFTHEALKCESVEQLAEFYWQQIDRELVQYLRQSTLRTTTTTTIYSTYDLPRVHLCGLSFGASVAFEMALKRTSRIASLALLDSGVTQSFLNGSAPIRPTVVSESEALYKFYQQYISPVVRLSVEQYFTVMAQLPTFDERVKFVVNEIIEKSQFQFASIDLEQAARSYVSKLIMSCKYVPREQLRLNELLLVKSASTSGDLIYAQEERNEQFMVGLRQVFTGRLKVQVIDADHRSFLEGEHARQVASILNEFLVKSF